MPLIRHSDAFLEKQKRKEQERKRIQKEKEIQEKQEIKLTEIEIYKRIRELQLKGKDRNSEETAELHDLIAIAFIKNIPIEWIFTLEENEVLFECMRQVRLNPEICEKVFGKDCTHDEMFRVTARIFEGLKYNIQIQKDFREMNRDAFILKYSKSEQAKVRFEQIREEKTRNKAIQENRNRNGGVFIPNKPERFMNELLISEDDIKNRPNYVRPLKKAEGFENESAESFERRVQEYIKSLNIKSETLSNSNNGESE